MPRTDGNGRNLKAVLGYILNQSVTDNEICEAIGVNRNSYYARRRKADDYPNAEECRLVAKFYGLNPVDLMMLFGLLEAEDVRRYAERFLAGLTADNVGRPSVSPSITDITGDDSVFNAAVTPLDVPVPLLVVPENQLPA